MEGSRVVCIMGVLGQFTTWSYVEFASSQCCNFKRVCPEWQGQTVEERGGFGEA